VLSEFELAEFETLEALLRRAPFHQWLDLKLLTADAEQVRIEMPWRDEIISAPEPPRMHGGILASLLDLAGLFAVRAAGGQPMGTAYLHVDYLRTASPGPVTVVAKPIKLGRRLSTADAEVIDQTGRLLATGRGGYIGQ
jgi:uncharacterized protein (TIGR00369 family)